MRSVCLGLLAGTCLLQQQAELPALSWLVALCLLALLMAAGAVFLRLPSRYRIPLRLIAGAITRIITGIIAGFVCASLWAHWNLRQELPHELEQKDLLVSGVISSLPADSAGGLRFFFDVEQVRVTESMQELTPDQRARFPAQISLGWYAQGETTLPLLKPGQRWQLKLRLKRPQGTMNPDGFDYEVWLLEQGVRATGAVRPGPENQQLDAWVWGLHYAAERMRGTLRERIRTALPGQPFAGIVVALVIGEQRDIPQQDWVIFSRTGISHLISISGMHITMIAGLFAVLASWLWRRTWFWQGRQMLWLPAQKVAALTGALVAIVYVVLAGFGVPAQRTMYMLIVVAIAVWSGRATSFSAVLSLALAVVILLDPWAVLWPGFWLSFAAVGVIIYAASGPQHVAADRWQRYRHMLGMAGRTQYAVTLGLVPLTMYLFGQISLISPLANAVAIPVISFVVTPMALMGSVLPGVLSVWVLQGAHAVLVALYVFLSWLSASPLAVWSAAMPSLYATVLAAAGIGWMLAPKGWPLRWLGALCCLPLFFPPRTLPPASAVQFLTFDVGQGTAVLIETTHHRMLYDTGPAYSAESDGGNRVILPYLKARGINALDLLMISHQDTDHSGGAQTLLNQLRVMKVSSSLPAEHALTQFFPSHTPCVAGQRWVWDEVAFEVLQPVAASYDSSKWKPNARSCVLKVSTSRFAMLLTGDIEAVQEDELVNSIPEKLRANVLLAPHHGSGTSSTAPFLQAVQPDWALFQFGYLNRYRHPKPEVYQRYAAFGINRLRTDESGAIQLRFDSSLTLSEFRRQHARYWYRR